MLSTEQSSREKRDDVRKRETEQSNRFTRDVTRRRLRSTISFEQLIPSSHMSGWCGSSHPVSGCDDGAPLSLKLHGVRTPYRT